VTSQDKAAMAAFFFAIMIMLVGIMVKLHHMGKK
jgi:hypothetical protein